MSITFKQLIATINGKVIGKNFNESLYKNIIAGTTTHKEIQAMFGPPFKKVFRTALKFGLMNIMPTTRWATI